MGARRLDGEMELLLHRDPRLLPDDDALHRALVHHVVHLLVARIEPAGAVREHGWIAAGLAHHFEAQRVDGTCRHTCHQGRAQPPAAFWKGDWNAAARALVAVRDADDPWLRRLLSTHLDDLDLADRALAFAFVRFLKASPDFGGDALGSLVRGLKSGADLDDLLLPLGGIDGAQRACTQALVPQAVRNGGDSLRDVAVSRSAAGWRRARPRPGSGGSEVPEHTPAEKAP